METTTNQGVEAPLRLMLAVLWRRKFLLLAAGLAATGLGAAYAFTAAPQYQAKAILTPKKSASGGGAPGILSQLGRIGVAASSLGMANTSLTIIQVLLQSPEVVEGAVTSGNLMPRLYAELWDPHKKAWKPEAKVPSLRETVEKIRNTMMVVEADPKRDLVTLHVSAPDSNLAPDMTNLFLVELERKIQRDVRKEARKNHEFLETQLVATLDPLLREKIQSLMAAEIEKSMLVSSATFEVLEPPMVPLYRSSPKRKQLLALSFLMGLFLGGLGILAYDRRVREAVFPGGLAA